jgi:hypothetical protein
MASRMIHVSFNFNLNIQKAIISGITKEPISRPINFTSDGNSYFSYIELDHIILSNISDVPKNSKWCFSWKQYHNHEQFLYLEQYVPFPVSDFIFQPNKYHPWSTLASFSYIAHPSKGTIQTSKIHRQINPNFKNKFQLTMEVLGKPSVTNWHTNLS